MWDAVQNFSGWLWELIAVSSSYPSKAVGTVSRTLTNHGSLAPTLEVRRRGGRVAPAKHRK